MNPEGQLHVQNLKSPTSFWDDNDPQEQAIASPRHGNIQSTAKIVPTLGRFKETRKSQFDMGSGISQPGPLPQNYGRNISNINIQSNRKVPQTYKKPIDMPKNKMVPSQSSRQLRQSPERDANGNVVKQSINN